MEEDVFENIAVLLDKSSAMKEGIGRTFKGKSEGNIKVIGIDGVVVVMVLWAKLSAVLLLLSSTVVFAIII